MTISNNVIKFRMGEEETFRAMISTARNFSRYYNLPGRETVQGTFLDKCFDNNIKNQREKLLNESYIYGLYFQGDGATIKDTLTLNILAGRFTYLCKHKILWPVQFKSQVVTIRMLNLLWRVSLI